MSPRHWLQSARTKFSRCFVPILGRRFDSDRKRTFRGLAVESLESRVMPTAVDWVGGAAGNWNVPGNWSTGILPGGSDDVTINSGSVVTIQSGDNFSIKSLTTGASD